MKSFLKTMGLLANDLGASLLFVILFSLTQNVRLVTQSRLRAMPAKQRESLRVMTGWSAKPPVPASR